MPDAGSRRGRRRYSFETRCHTVRLMLDGMSAAAAAASVGAGPTSAYRWLARYRAGGWAGLRERPSSTHWRRLLVEAIAGFSAERGYPPTIRDLLKATGASSTSVVWHWLEVCEREGLLVREPGLSRAITLTAAGWALAGLPPEHEPTATDGARPEPAA
ncbi:MAG: helix-turn-helix domain-containing protein [Chloroflexi bacterium]|nr:helix-turn-helix domain-containing protein [Chloroflexota bacterium]